MTVRRRILALVGVSVVFIVVMIGVMAMGLRAADRFVQRVDGVHRRLEGLSELDRLSAKYAGQVAKVLLLGRDQMSQLQTARLDMERAFVRLTQVTRNSISSLGNSAAIEDELPDLENARRMIELYHNIDLSAARAVVLQRDGNQTDAINIFRSDVEFRLQSEFTALLESGLQGERNQVVTELAEVQTTRNTYTIAALVVALLGLTAIITLALQLRRAIVGPLAALAAGTTAIAEGNLDPAITLPGRDDFALLGQNLNAMAGAIKERQAELLASGEKLTSAMDARTLQLSQANERLRDIDNRRAQFLADVSHELRTPLTILRGEADVALRGRSHAAEQRQSLERIQGQAVEMSQLLDDLLSFARSDAEPQNLLIAETRLADILAAAVQEGETLAEPREVTITLDAGDNGARINADFRRLRQAIIIGIDNAVKHSPPGSRIDIASALAGDTVRIQIRDEGPGITEEDKLRVFDRFFRGRNGSEEGLGIGLSIARDIIERHDGTVTLDNRAEGGAVLTIGLPLFEGPRP